MVEFSYAAAAHSGSSWYWPHQRELLKAIDQHRLIVVKKPRRVGFRSVIRQVVLGAFQSREKFSALVVSDQFERPLASVADNVCYMAAEEQVKGRRYDLIVVEEYATAPKDFDLNALIFAADKVIVASTPGPVRYNTGEFNQFYSLWTTNNAFHKVDWAGLRDRQPPDLSPDVIANEYRGEFFFQPDVIPPDTVTLDQFGSNYHLKVRRGNDNLTVELTTDEVKNIVERFRNFGRTEVDTAAMLQEIDNCYWNGVPLHEVVDASADVVARVKSQIQGLAERLDK